MKKQVWLTAYDAPTAALLEEAGVDGILVGDSVGMVLLGYDSTKPVTVEEMLHHIRAVKRGAKKTPIVGDLPLKAVEKGPALALRSAQKFMDAGCAGVKLEWRPDFYKILDTLRRRGIPVMGHFGLTPQSMKKGEKFGLRATSEREAEALIQRALEAERRGVFSVLLEYVPWPLAKTVADRLKIPVIGIGAGKYCDGQILVFQDVIGTFKKFKPKFTKQFAQLYAPMLEAVRRYAGDTRAGVFPGPEHSFNPEES